MENILFIDDYEPSALIMQHIIEEMGYSFTYARTGAAALDYVNDNEYCLIFVDLNLPDIRGDQLALQLRQKGIVALIIGFTADIESVLPDEANCFDRLVQKTLQPDEVKRHLLQWL